MLLYRRLFKKAGQNFIFDPYGIYTFHNITVGNDVYIGPGATLLSQDSEIILKDKIMFGPNVTLITGDHNSSTIGTYMYDNKIKLPENDKPIIIENDVWLGAGVTVLKGVTIGTGCIVAAGAVVTKDIKAYTISAGIPSRVIKDRFDPNQLKLHLEKLQENYSIT